jgi:hypothetical protein
MTATCAEPTCSRPVKARGLCETHYERQRTAGRSCSYPACGRAIRAKGLCKTHYDRARNKGRVCEVRGCRQPVKAAGLCFTHYMSRITEGKGCSVTGCVRRVRSRGLCKRHYEEALAAGSVCVISGCRRAPLGGEGMCYMHRRRYLADGDAGDAAPLRAPDGAGSINADGYRTFYVPARGRRMGEHQLVMEAVLGRQLTPHELVHHKNGIRLDNRPNNLELWVIPHPPGQRVADLVAWVVDQYPDDVRVLLEQRQP